MACLGSPRDPKTFLFQFLASLAGLFLLTQISSYFGGAVRGLGLSLVLVYTSWELALWIQRTYFHKLVEGRGRAVLVTGCDSGFGHALATRLNAAGFTVLAACLNPEGPGALALVTSAPHPDNTVLVGLDVTSDQDVERALADVNAALRKTRTALWALVNNAGVFGAGHVEWGGLAEYQRLFEVNVLGLVRMSRSFLPLLRQSKGRLVNVASIAGRISSPGLSAYSMSKHAVVAFSNALRREMLPWGVRVCTIEPAIYRTPMGDGDALHKLISGTWASTSGPVKEDYGLRYFEDVRQSMLEMTAKGRDASEVVDALMDAVAAVQPQIRYKVCGLDYAVLWALSDYLPFSIMDHLSRFRRPKTMPKLAHRDYSKNTFAEPD